MTRRVLETVRAHGMLRRGDRVLLAVSGGMDSVAMAHVFLELRERYDLALTAAHFHHGLRGEEADRDAEFVSKLTAEWGIPCELGYGDAAAEARRTGRGIEDAARVLRYDYLESILNKYRFSRLLTAHTADDLAETVLLHLVRGGGVAALAGIPPVRGRIIRPLLGVTRAEVERYCEEHALPHVEDSTNGDVCFARNRIRHCVIPELKKLNPSLQRTLFRSASLARDDAACLDAMAAELLGGAARGGEETALPLGSLREAPRAVASRAVILAARAAGAPEPPCRAVGAALGIARGENPSARVALGGGFEAARVYDVLVVRKTPPIPEAAARSEALPLAEGTPAELPLWRVACERAIRPAAPEAGALYLRDGAYAVRTRRTGDRMHLAGKPGSRALKRLMIDAKIPAAERGGLPVILCGERIAAVCGLGVSEDFAAKPGGRALKITARKKETATEC